MDTPLMIAADGLSPATGAEERVDCPPEGYVTRSTSKRTTQTDCTERSTSSSSTAAPRTSAHTTLEAALEAWAACRPDGYYLPSSSVKAAMALIEKQIPCNRHDEETVEKMHELFVPVDGHPPVFWHLLKVRSERVHFLDFWAALSAAIQFVHSAPVLDQGLSVELETVRDNLLRLVDGAVSAADDAAGVAAVQARDIVTAIRGAAEMSEAPSFWLAAERSLLEEDCVAPFSLEYLSGMMMGWLQDAIVWQHEDDDNMLFRGTPSAHCLPHATAVDQSCAARCFTMPWPSLGKLIKRRQPEMEPVLLPVLIHIYDVSQEEGVQKINRIFAHKNSPLKFGGVFHAGVEVNGLEWSYGMSLSDTMPGISCVLPRSHEAHHYRQTVTLRWSTRFTAEEIADLISQLIEEYPGHDYNLLRRNCCHFADDFCRRMGVGGIPGWVHRLARVGALVDGTMQRVMNRKLLPDDMDGPVEDW